MEGMGQKFIPTLARSFLGLLYVSLDLELMFLGLIATLKNCLYDCFCHLHPTPSPPISPAHTQQWSQISAHPKMYKMIENPTSSQLEGQPCKQQLHQYTLVRKLLQASASYKLPKVKFGISQNTKCDNFIDFKIRSHSHVAISCTK